MLGKHQAIVDHFEKHGGIFNLQWLLIRVYFKMGKDELKDQYRYNVSSDILDLHVENVCHLLNHKPRKSLKGKHAWQCFSERQKYLKRQRKEIYDQVVYYSKEILKEVKIDCDKKLSPKQAKRRNITIIRQASKQVMLEKNIIKITLLSAERDEVLPV